MTLYLELSQHWYLHQPESHKLSLNMVLDSLTHSVTSGPIDRTPGLPGSDKKEPWEQFAICATLHFIRGKIYILQMSTMFDCRQQVQGRVSADSDCRGLYTTHLVQPPTHQRSFLDLLLSCHIPQPTDMSARGNQAATVNGSGLCQKMKLQQRRFKGGAAADFSASTTGLQQMTPSVKIKGTHGHYYWSKMDTQHKLYQPPLSLAPTL